MRRTGHIFWACQILHPTAWKLLSPSHEPIHFQISGLPAVNSSECQLLQPEFRGASWADGGHCQIAVFADSSCTHLIESASAAYDSEAIFERRVILQAVRTSSR
eukprot:Skav200983  [mRNA]  locus=scaffold1596:105683:107397:- [translate_table: standard]